jgi:hypothetical protein
MATRITRPKKTKLRTAVGLAVLAVQGSGRPLEVGVGDPDTSPTSLGLPTPQQTTPCSHHQYVCAICGTALQGNPE